MEILKTDVLVVGGGGAGLRAALAAREKGAEVLIVAKTPIGKTTSTYLSVGAFAVAAGGVSRETQLASTLKSGKGINDRDLVAILVSEAPERIRELEQWGLVGEWQKGRFLCPIRPTAAGAPLANTLAAATVKQGISSVPWVIISELVTASGKIAGALGFDFHKGKKIAFLSKAVILANGGGGALYPRNDNPVRATGDGYALAFHAGCRLRDMEFVQFIPTGLAEAGKPAHLLAARLPDMGRVVNSLGEDVLQKYGITEKPVVVHARDSFSLAIFKEEMEGRQVFLDLRSLSEKDWLAESVVLGQRDMLIQHFSAAVKPLRISPMCHFFMGGVSIDQNGGTGISGLYAAGEIVGGLHGANRMGGNALSEILVFGYRAGKAAGEWAGEHDGIKGARDLLRGALDSFPKEGTGSVGLAPKSIRKKIAGILWKEGGILREESGLASALQELKRIKEEDLPRAAPAGPKETLEKIEAENALLVAEMIVGSARLRRESRGAHFRSDFPQMDDAQWKGNVFLKKSAGGMEVSFHPLREDIS